MTEKKTFLYIVSSLSQRGASVCFIILLTFLLPSNYFVSFGLLVSLTQVLVPLSTLSAHTSVGRLMFDVESGQRERMATELFSTGLCFTTVKTVVVIAVVLFLELFSGYNLAFVPTLTYILAFLSFAASGTLLRAKGMASGNLLLSLIYGWVPCASLLTFAFFVPEQSVLEGSLVLSSLVVIGACIFVVRQHFSLSAVSIAAYRKLISFGWPLSFYLFFLSGFTSGSRLVAVSLGLTKGLESLTLLVFITGVLGSFTRSAFESIRAPVGDACSKSDYLTINKLVRRACLTAFKLICVAVIGLFTANILFGGSLPDNYYVTNHQLLLASAVCFCDIASVRGNWNLMIQKRTRLLMFFSLAAFTSYISFLYIYLSFPNNRISVELILCSMLVGHFALFTASNAVFLQFRSRPLPACPKGG